MNTISNQSQTQDRIDSLAYDLQNNRGRHFDPATLADLLDLCPAQNVWMYEPDPLTDHIFATFKLEATNGSLFFMGCLLNTDNEVLEWIGPFDLVPPSKLVSVQQSALAA